MKKIVLLAAMMLMGVQNMNAQNETNECGTLIVPAIYDNIKVVNNGLYVVSSLGQEGVIDSNGKVIVPIKYQYVYTEESKDGLFIVGKPDKNGNSKGCREGVVDSNGKIVIPIKYETVSLGKDGEECGGLILVRNSVSVDDMSHNIFGLYNKDGVELIPMGDQFISIRNHRGFNGLAIVWKGSDYYLRYKDGTMSPSYEVIRQEKNGLFSVKKDGRYGAMNKNGEIIIPIKYGDISIRYDNGLVRVETPYQSGGIKYGIFNDQGQEIVPVGKYESVDINKNYIEVKKGSKKGILNQKGVEIVPIGLYEECRVRECDERKQYYIEIESNKKRGAVNDNGKVFIPIGKYQRFKVLNDKLITAVESNGKTGIVDKEGTMLVPIGKYNILSYRYGMLIYSQNGKWGILDEKGNQATPAEYDRIEPSRHSYGMAMVAKDGKVGVMNKEGKLIVPFGNYNGGNITDDIVKLSSADGTLFVKTNGDSLLPLGKFDCAQNKYGKLSPLNVNAKYGLFKIESNGKCGVVKLW